MCCGIKMGSAVGKSQLAASVPETKLEAKMVEAMRQRAEIGTSIKSFNSLILKFPKIDESLRNCKTTFQQFDEHANGTIDQQELKHCFQKLGISISVVEINDLFKVCDIDQSVGMKFNEFIVLCLVYFLEDPAALHAKSKMGIIRKYWLMLLHFWIRTKMVMSAKVKWHKQ